MTTNRRTFLKTTAGLAAGTTLCSTARAQVPRDQTPDNFKISKGRINQSVMGWCFNPMPTPDLASASKKIGLVAMEGIQRKHYPLVKKLGMTISLVGSH